eukprot:CAMPEP_0178968824 /NCGR_PEP_ID=MMETSP0789-20121207/18485_1 /TAXON_ID=3005 /ORGANISM="Rhizosolenia setigera, Strain CCMP 1694" /LENGTH=100 /DNA_ID=CAMNT_0020654829 /DNA_START=221 /DNA_END=520 /DNA_ORIENTATION=+
MNSLSNTSNKTETKDDSPSVSSGISPFRRRNAAMSSGYIHVHGGKRTHGQSINSMPRVKSRTNKLIRRNNGLVKGMKKRGAESSDTVKLHMMNYFDVDSD